MVTRRLKTIECLLALILFPYALYGGGAGTSNAEFLRIGAGTEATAMGGAYTALATDHNASFWNPAGLAYLSGRSFSIMHLSWFESLNYEFVSYADQISDSEGIGAHLIYFWVPDFNATIDESGNALDAEAGKMSDLALAVSYGSEISNERELGRKIAFGATLKAISRTLMDQNRLSYALDLGLMFCSDKGLCVAGKIQNIGTAIDDDASPLEVTLGLGLQPENSKLRAAFDIIRPVDLANPDDQRWGYRIGAEYTLYDMLALRMGYQGGEDLTGFTAGIGGSYRFVKLDYAFVPYGELGYTHRFSVTIHFSDQKTRYQKKEKRKEYAPMLFREGM